jgi:hypothetical protein
MNQPSGIVNVKDIHSFLTLVVMVAPLAWVGQTQAKGKPKAEISQASAPTPRYQTNTIPCPVALPLETEGKTLTCGVLTVPENHEQRPVAVARSGLLLGRWTRKQRCG